MIRPSRRFGAGALAGTTLATVVALSLLTPPAVSATVDLTAEQTVPVQYLAPNGTDYVTGVLPTVLEAPDECAYLNLPFVPSGISAANTISVRVEIWSRDGIELTSGAIYSARDWNPSGGVTQLRLFDCAWSPGTYDVTFWAGASSSTLTRQSTAVLEVRRPKPEPQTSPTGYFSVCVLPVKSTAPCGSSRGWSKAKKVSVCYYSLDQTPAERTCTKKAYRKSDKKKKMTIDWYFCWRDQPLDASLYQLSRAGGWTARPEPVVLETDAKLCGAASPYATTAYRVPVPKTYKVTDYAISVTLS